jgi:hypothetical protein
VEPAVAPAAPVKAPSIFARLAKTKSIGLELLKSKADVTPPVAAPAENTASPAPTVAPAPIVEKKIAPTIPNLNESKPAISGDISPAKPVAPVPAPVVVPPPVVAEPIAAAVPQAAPPAPAVVKQPKAPIKISPRKLWTAGVIVGLLAIFSLMTWLTEIGFVSVGLEKVYGAVNIQALWGGLPANGELALGKSFVVMKDNPNFEVSGTLVVDIDRTKNSTVTKPLVSYFPDIYVKETVQKAKLAVYTGYDVDGSSVDATPTDTTTSTDTTDSSATSDTTTAADTTTSASSVASSSKQEDFPAYQNVTSTIKELNADVTGSFTDNGGSAKFQFKKPVGSTDVELKQQAGKLWLKSKIAFTKNQDATKWMEMGMGPVKAGNSIVESLFSASPADGLSATGSRVGNEKIGNVRTYHYNFKSLEIGDSLIALGIKNEMVDSISGDVWIGIKDQKIQKIDLKITPAPSYSVTMLKLSLTLSNFGEAEFAKPLATEILPASFVSQ